MSFKAFENQNRFDHPAGFFMKNFLFMLLGAEQAIMLTILAHVCINMKSIAIAYAVYLITLVSLTILFILFLKEMREKETDRRVNHVDIVTQRYDTAQRAQEIRITEISAERGHQPPAQGWRLEEPKASQVSLELLD